MPIYAYKCTSCGFAKDVLQKLSDLPLTNCPTCGESAFRKQLTAAGFQLKGSGWYATDFKGGAPASSDAPAAAEATQAAAAGAAPVKDSTTKSDSVVPAATGGCGGGCACH